MKVRRGFSLIELSAVVVLLGLLAGAVSWSLADTANRMKVTDAVDQLGYIDANARQNARRSGQPITLTFDLIENAITRNAFQNSNRSNDSQSHVWHLPKGFTIQQIVAGEESHDTGQVKIICSVQGYTPTYGLLLQARDGQQQWMIVAGLTGQVVLANNEQEIQNIFQAMARGGSNAR